MPSKKVLSAIILVAAVVTAAILAFGREKSSEVINYASNLSAGEKVSIPENPNWQNDMVKLSDVFAESAQPENSSSDGTITDQVAVSLVSNYLSLKQNGTLDSESAQKLIDQTISFIEKNQKPTEEISFSGLNIVADNGIQNITAYGENLGSVAKRRTLAQIQKDFGVIIKIIQLKNETTLAELDDIISAYQKIVLDLTKMPVPQSFTKTHLDIVNGASGLTSSLEEFRSVLDDPFRGLMAFSVYQQNLTKISEALSETVALLKQKGVIYKQGSGGYYLLYGI